MAHEITETDGLVLTGQPAWHGLGRVVEEAPTPYQALHLAKLDWNVLESPNVSGIFEFPGEAAPVRISDNSKKILVRSDTREVLATVGIDYVPVQNEELADLAYEIAGEASDGVRVESAASIMGGKRTWFLLRGETVGLNHGKDEQRLYLLLSNGHDGKLALSAMPTAVRVVCKNTLNLALSQGKRLCWFKHEGNMDSKRKEIGRALASFVETGKTYKEQAESLVSKALTVAQIQGFWTEVYTKLEGEIPVNPKDKYETRAKNAAVDALGTWANTFDKERNVAGANAWNAFNAVTNWYDHSRNVRGGTEKEKNAKRLEKSLFGDFSESKAEVMKMALAI